MYAFSLFIKEGGGHKIGDRRERRGGGIDRNTKISVKGHNERLIQIFGQFNAFFASSSSRMTLVMCE